LRLHHGLSSRKVGRLRPYVDGTLRALRGELRQTPLRTLNPASLEQSALSKTVIDAVLAMKAEGPGSPKYVIAYPVPRPRKQRFSSRNYPLHTPRRADLLLVGQAFKRRVRANQGLWLHRGEQGSAQVVPIGQASQPHVPAGALFIRAGMLCSAIRSQSTVTGIVSAIHTSGRLTLRVPVAVTADSITWRTVVVSPRQRLRVISTDRVLLLNAQ
jgi:hypothetical protein